MPDTTPRPKARRLPPVVRKPRRVRPLGMIDVEALDAAVERLSQTAWARHDAVKQNDYACFADTRHLIFRFIPKGCANPRAFYSEPAWTVFRPLLEPVLRSASAPYGFVRPAFPRVMLARLLAGAAIPLHRDNLPSDAYTHKIHVALQTNGAALLRVAGKALHLERGRACELNNWDSHGAVNGGSADRVHLIFEVFDAAA